MLFTRVDTEQRHVHELHSVLNSDSYSLSLLALKVMHETAETALHELKYRESHVVPMSSDVKTGKSAGEVKKKRFLCVQTQCLRP